MPVLIFGITADKAPSSVRDQIFDHQSNTVCYYLDREVKFNTQAAFLSRPSDEVVQKLARVMTLTVNANASNTTFRELLKKMANNKRMVQSGRTSKDLTEKFRGKYRLVRLTPPNDPLLRQRSRWMPFCTGKKPTVVTGCSKKQKNDISETLTRLPSRFSLSVRLSQRRTNNVKPPVPLQYDIPE